MVLVVLAAGCASDKILTLQKYSFAQNLFVIDSDWAYRDLNFISWRSSYSEQLLVIIRREENYMHFKAFNLYELHKQIIKM